MPALEATTTLPPHLADEFYLYADGAVLVEVQVNTDGVWRPTSREADPNGRMGFRFDLYGPDAQPVPGGVELRLGYNRFLVRIDGGAPVDGGAVYVGEPGGWVDPYDPAVYSAIVTGVANPAATIPTPYPFAVQTALAVATGILSSLTFGLIHPAGYATDEFHCGSQPHRLALQHRPVTNVESVRLLTPGAEFGALPDGTWSARGDSVRLQVHWSPAVRWRSSSPSLPATTRDIMAGEFGCGTDDVGVTLQVRYRFGSTISAGARGAVLYLARQHYLRGQNQRCELPSRATSVNREGVSIQIDVEQTYLNENRTGVPVVDQWLATVHPGGKRRSRAAVYDTGAPPARTIEFAVSL